MDEADITAARAEFDYRLSLEASRKPNGPAPTGFCLNCSEPLPDGQRFCDRFCRDDWLLRKTR